jgi:hypothetical protein
MMIIIHHSVIFFFRFFTISKYSAATAARHAVTIGITASQQLFLVSDSSGGDSGVYPVSPDVSFGAPGDS